MSDRACSKNRPFISVLMPVYNAERYLADAIESILEQSYSDFEFIIVNDGSTDKSQAIINRYQETDARIKAIEQANGGIVSALNAGIEQAQGTYLARMDADDIAMPERFSTQVDFLEEHADYVGIGSWVDFIDPEGALIWTYRTFENSDAVQRELLNGTIAGLVHPAMMMRLDTVREVGSYIEAYKYIEDYELFTRLSEKGKLASLPTSLLKYRQHLTSINAVASVDERVDKKTISVNTFRAKHGLAPITFPKVSKDPHSIKSHWVHLAMLDGHLKTAGKHLASILLETPTRGSSWFLLLDWLRSCLIHTAQKTKRTLLPK